MAQFITDSGALLALLDVKDKFHASAKQFVAANRTATFLIPEFIFAETMTLVKARLGARAAIQLGEQIQRSDQFHLIHLTDEERQAVWTLFSQYDDKDWSYPDCSLLALAQRMGLPTVFSFDRHISQMAGLKRIP
jgi:predicted nucleic acid-binding protein